MRYLLADPQFESILGMDVSWRSLEIAKERLKLDQLPERQKARINLIQGSLMYRDQRLSGFDAAAVIEVIEHLDAPRLSAFERVLFEFARPTYAVITTPNSEDNSVFETLPAGQFPPVGAGSCSTIWLPVPGGFFNEDRIETAFLTRLRDAVEKAGLWAELGTEWLCLDRELMPWPAKAQELLRQQYAPVGNSGLQSLIAEHHLLAQARERISGLDELADRTTLRLHAMQQYVREYQRYCWPVESLDDFKLAPFHLLVSEGSVHTDKRHTWHMEMIAKVCEADERLLQATPFQLVDLNDTLSCDTAIEWWTDLTTAGREGMVVKPLDFISKGRRGTQQRQIDREQFVPICLKAPRISA